MALDKNWQKTKLFSIFYFDVFVLFAGRRICPLYYFTEMFARWNSFISQKKVVELIEQPDQVKLTHDIHTKLQTKWNWTKLEVKRNRREPTTTNETILLRTNPIDYKSVSIVPGHTHNVVWNVCQSRREEHLWI